MTVWLVCEAKGDKNETPCLYTENTARRLKSDPLRCVRHGDILQWRHTRANERKAAQRELGFTKELGE